ncbi:CheR family methyltransferase [Pelagibaculum spongiae]|uniref:protein-glutamate O-methyltransferase n=1 Tax=Pelagibaculum spongiae TaxID=2080658 RepID=A0A2V1H6V0_9GAMM|nr:protein-glutamate O-methyltransferase CheR [Pelagibaculum spongiae]PVZ72162.1 methyltransferase [Pelagibaculum spongiae]
MATRPWYLQPLTEMSDEEFGRWQQLVEARTGIYLPDHRRSFLLTSLAIRMRENGVKSYEEYYDWLLDGPRGMVEWATLVDRLTVHETRFFRHQPSFNLVADYIDNQLKLATGDNCLQMWSLGCATGEETWSLAMLADNCLKHDASAEFFSVFATDISLPALASAREGVYTSRRLDGMDPGLVDEYFIRLENDHYRVINRLRSRVCYSQLNVLDLNYSPLRGVHIIFCQNLLIYFSESMRRQLLDQLVDRLAPGGLLVLGPGEMINWDHPGLTRVAYDNTLAFTRT